MDQNFFEDENNIPTDFNSKTDLMVGDFTSGSNPNMYAYQAQKLNKKNRKYVIQIMQQYDEDFNTPWERTDDSLLLGWKDHHKYRMVDSAQNIDFDNFQFEIKSLYQ